MKEKKELMEKRAKLIEEMNELTENIARENRAFTEAEQKEFNDRTAEVKRIDATVAAAEEMRALSEKAAAPEQEQVEDVEVRAFANIIRQRADSNITKTDNGAVIPTTIAKKIIDRVADISPVFGSAEKFNIKGNVAIPYVDTQNDNLTVAYADEFTDLEAKSTKLLTVTLSDYLAGVLAKISRSLLNCTDLDLTGFVIEKIAQAAAVFADKETLIGTPAVDSTPAKITGLSNIEQLVAAGSTSAISMDALISLKDALKTPFQQSAYWVMHPTTLDVVRHLKDGENRYYVLDDISKDFGVSLLGKPVYTSDQMPQIASGKNVIFYGDFGQALAAKIVEDSVQLLTEKYATQHALGVVAWMDFDCKIQNQQAVAGLKMVASL